MNVEENDDHGKDVEDGVRWRVTFRRYVLLVSNLISETISTHEPRTGVITPDSSCTSSLSTTKD